MAAAPLPEKATVTIGPEPHAHCAKCFAADDAHNDVQLPEDPLGAPVYDEKGRKLDAVREREPVDVPMQRRPQQIQEGNGLGDYENRPYG